MDFMAITTIAVLALSGSLVLAGGFGLCVEFSRLRGGRAPPSWVAPITVRLPALIVSAAAGGLRLAAMLTRGDVLPMLSVILPFVLGVRGRLVTKNFHLEIYGSLFRHIHGALNVVKQ